MDIYDGNCGYRLTVSVASLKQTRSSVHSALEIFCWCAI